MNHLERGATVGDMLTLQSRFNRMQQMLRSRTPTPVFDALVQIVCNGGMNYDGKYFPERLRETHAVLMELREKELPVSSGGPARDAENGPEPSGLADPHDVRAVQGSPLVGDLFPVRASVSDWTVTEGSLDGPSSIVSPDVEAEIGVAMSVADSPLTKFTAPDGYTIEASPPGGELKLVPDTLTGTPELQEVQAIDVQRDADVPMSSTCLGCTCLLTNESRENYGNYCINCFAAGK